MTDSVTHHAFSIMPGSCMPTVTFAMLLDFLIDHEILWCPKTTRRSFRWFVAASKDTADCIIPETATEAQLLFVTNAQCAKQVLREHPAAFALVLAKNKEELESINAYSDRFAAIQQESRFSFFLFALQSYFMKIMIWETELDSIVLRKGTLFDMLDASTPVLQNFMFITDNNFNVIARTSLVDPPDDLHRHIIDTGCLSPQMIEEKRKRLPEKVFYDKPPSDLTPYPRLSHPLHLSHLYFGSLSMSCNKKPPTEGLKDLFSILMRRIMPLCERLWRADVKLNLPHYFFFVKMLEHEPVTDEYLHLQMSIASLDADMQYKLIVMEVDEAVDPQLAAQAAKASSRMNQGSVFSFSYKGALLVLCYTPPNDSLLSHRRTAEELEDRVYQPFGVQSGVSSIFEHITDLDLAYRQAKIALGLKNTIHSEQFASDEEYRKGVYLFEDAFLYFLVDSSSKEERFMTFCFSHTILQKLYREDIENGTNYLALFWFFLQSERNATAVAQRLHMHRNTVLYHIDKIQKRFDFDLSLKVARDRMLLDFKALFLTESNESIEKLFAEAQDNSAM